MITPAEDDDQLDELDSTDTDETSDPYLPARMINEAVYCPRLFYLMHVEGQFAHNAETVDGDSVHRRVDRKTDALAAPAKAMQLALPLEEPVAEMPDQQTAPWQISPPITKPSVISLDDVHPVKAVVEKEKIHARSVTLASDRLGVVAKL